MKTKPPMEAFLLCTILSLGVVGPLITVMSYMDDINKIGVIVSDISRILEATEPVRLSNEKVPNGFDIEVRNVSFAYGEKKVLKNASLHIPGGSVTAFVGPMQLKKLTLASALSSRDCSICNI